MQGAIVLTSAPVMHVTCRRHIPWTEGRRPFDIRIPDDEAPDAKPSSSTEEDFTTSELTQPKMFKTRGIKTRALGSAPAKMHVCHVEY